MSELPAEATSSQLAPPPTPPERRGVASRIVRVLLFPLFRVIEPRFADTNRRLDDTRKALHEESNLTRWVLERDLQRLAGAVDTYAGTTSESMTFVGTNLRELQEEMRALSGQLEQLTERLERIEAARDALPRE